MYEYIKMLWKMLVVLCVMVQVCLSSRVLVMFPMASRSHTILGDSIVRTLVDAGHEVTYISTFTKEKESDRLRLIDISSVNSEVTERERLNLLELVRNPRPSHFIQKVGSNFARRALQHPATQELLQNPYEHFDAVVAQWFYSGLLAPLAAVYDCPLIWYSTEDVSWMNLRLVHGQTNPAYSVSLQATKMASAPSSVWERVNRIWQQAYLSGWVYYMTHYVETPTYREIYESPLQLRGRGLLDYESLVYNGSLLLVNSQPLLGQLLPVPPNVKYVGGHHIDVPTKPLPQNLQELLDKSKNGVIFFSLGSNINSKEFPEGVKRGLVEVLGQLEQTVLWKIGEQLENLPENVHIVDWAPQHSILNHTNTVMMITHGGFLSYMEAMFYGVPIIGIPFFGDQFLTMDIAAARGRGIAVKFSEDLPVKLKQATDEILGNYSYRSNAQQASAIFQNNLVPSTQEILYWIELVISTSGASHLRSPAVQLSIMERLHLDVVMTGLMILWFLSKVLKVWRAHAHETEDEEDKKTQ